MATLTSWVIVPLISATLCYVALAMIALLSLFAVDKQMRAECRFDMIGAAIFEWPLMILDSGAGVRGRRALVLLALLEWCGLVLIMALRIEHSVVAIVLFTILTPAVPTIFNGCSGGSATNEASTM